MWGSPRALSSPRYPCAAPVLCSASCSGCGPGAQLLAPAPVPSAVPCLPRLLSAVLHLLSHFSCGRDEPEPRAGQSQCGVFGLVPRVVVLGGAANLEGVGSRGKALEGASGSPLSPHRVFLASDVCMRCLRPVRLPDLGPDLQNYEPK